MCVCVCKFACEYLPTIPHEQDVTQGQFFKRSLTCLYLKFSFSKSGFYTKLKEPSLHYYLPIAGEIGCIILPRLLAQCEMQLGFELGLLCPFYLYDGKH